MLAKIQDTVLHFFNKYKYHFLVWSIFIAFEVGMGVLLGWPDSMIIEYIIVYIPAILLFYFHAHILLRYTIENPNKLLKYSLPLLIVLEILCNVVIRFLAERYYYSISHNQNFNINVDFKIQLGMKIYRAVYFAGISTVYYFLMRDRQQRQQLEEMNKQKLEMALREEETKNQLILTQNAFLRAQINPHFLINTLSYLYNITRKSVPKAADSMLSLSEIMQYALSKEIASGYVKLENEISLVESFLSLYQAQQNFKIQFKLYYDQKVQSVLIIPLILMSLAELILKHGKLDDPDQPAEIKIGYENSILRIKTANKQSINSDIPSQGISLKNIRDRLAIAYGEMATLDYHLDSAEYFHTAIAVRT